MIFSHNINRPEVIIVSYEQSYFMRITITNVIEFYFSDFIKFEKIFNVFLGLFRKIDNIKDFCRIFVGC